MSLKAFEMTAEEILEKNYSKFRISVGLTYEPMSDKAKKAMLQAMHEYADLMKKQHRREGYLASYTKMEAFYRIGAENFEHLKEEDFKILYGL